MLYQYILKLFALFASGVSFKLSFYCHIKSIYYYPQHSKLPDLVKIVINSGDIGLYFSIAYWSMIQYEEQSFRIFIAGASDQNPMTMISIGFRYVSQLKLFLTELYDGIGIVSKTAFIEFIFNVNTK